VVWKIYIVYFWLSSDIWKSEEKIKHYMRETTSMRLLIKLLERLEIQWENTGWNVATTYSSSSFLRAHHNLQYALLLQSIVIIATHVVFYNDYTIFAIVHMQQTSLIRHWMIIHFNSKKWILYSNFVHKHACMHASMRTYGWKKKKIK